MTKARLAFVSRRTAFGLGCLAVIVLATGCGLAFRKEVSASLAYRLTYARQLPESGSTHNDVVYVLGGTPDSLMAKFLTASKLVQERKAALVLVMHSQALMAFNPAVGRNLSANEWVVENLRAFGVTEHAIEFLAIDEGFFGTWSEAKGLSRFVQERGYRRIVLVTSRFHSRRVWESFSRTIENSDTTLFLYHSEEPAYLRHLLLEYVKLLVYRALLL